MAGSTLGEDLESKAHISRCYVSSKDQYIYRVMGPIFNGKISIYDMSNGGFENLSVDDLMEDVRATKSEVDKVLREVDFDLIYSGAGPGDLELFKDVLDSI